LQKYFSSSIAGQTASIPHKKDRAIRSLGSGRSLSSLSQNQSQSKAGRMPPASENNIVFNEDIIQT